MSGGNLHGNLQWRNAGCQKRYTSPFPSKGTWTTAISSRNWPVLVRFAWAYLFTWSVRLKQYLGTTTRPSIPTVLMSSFCSMNMHLGSVQLCGNDSWTTWGQPSLKVILNIIIIILTHYILNYTGRSTLERQPWRFMLITPKTQANVQFLFLGAPRN